MTFFKICKVVQTSKTQCTREAKSFLKTPIGALFQGSVPKVGNPTTYNLSNSTISYINASRFMKQSPLSYVPLML